VLVGLCESSWFGLLAAARHPERVSGVVAIAPGARNGTPKHDRGIDTAANWTADIAEPRGWEV
jgi:pimeloyl-ACP methyl ester carboxylesterase